MRNGRGSTAIEMLPQPELEDQQSPDLARIVPAAFDVLGDELLDELRFEPAALARTRVEKNIAHHRLELLVVAQPNRGRKAEALLLLSDRRFGKNPGHRALEEIALVGAAPLVARGQAARECDERGI